MKRFFLIFVIIILVVAFSAFVYTRIPQKPGATISQPIPITTITPLSTLPRAIDTIPQNVTFSYSGQVFSLPDHLPTYVVAYPTNLPSQAEQLAKQWGFTSPVKKTVAYVYDWIDNDKQFSYNDKDKSISFILFSPPSSGSPLYSLTPQVLFSTLASFQFFSNSFVFTETGRQVIQSGQGEGGFAGAANGTTTSITYAAAIANKSLPFLFSGFTKTTGSVQVDQRGRVIAFSFYVTPQIQQKQERQTLNTVDQILQELNGQRGYLAGLGTTTIIYPSEQTASFNQVTISIFSLAYLYIPKESRFIPIIEAEGMSNPGNQRVRYYVRISN